MVYCRPSLLSLYQSQKKIDNLVSLEVKPLLCLPGNYIGAEYGYLYALDAMRGTKD